MGIFEKFKPKLKEEQEKPRHWREIAEEEREEDEETEKLGKVLKELPEEREEEKEEIQEKPKHWREIAEEEREEDEEEKAMMRVIKETPEEKLERLEQSLEKKEKEYKKLKSIRTFFGLLKKEEKTEIEKEYEEAKKKVEESRKEYIAKETGSEEKKEASFDLIDITRKQYLQAVERKWPGYKIGALKSKYQDLINKLAEAEKEKRIEAEREELETANIKKEDIDYILQANGQKSEIKKSKVGTKNNEKKKLENMFGKGLRESYHNA